MQVIIDGVPFAPACSAVGRIGIAITTHNRADVLSRAIEQHQNIYRPVRWWLLLMMDQHLPP